MEVIRIIILHIYSYMYSVLYSSDEIDIYLSDIHAYRAPHLSIIRTSKYMYDILWIYYILSYRVTLQCFTGT